jgi:hypothetical protein
MNPQIDNAGAVEAARQRRQEEIRARLAAGGSTAAALAAVAEDASVTVQQQAADYYTADEMAKVGSEASVVACRQLAWLHACMLACITYCLPRPHVCLPTSISPCCRPAPFLSAVPEAQEEEGTQVEEKVGADGG